MRLQNLAVGLSLLFFSLTISAQQYPGMTPEEDFPVFTKKDSMVASSWILFAGFNAVNDSGDGLRDYFVIKDQWNAVPFPSRMALGRNFSNGLSLDLIGTYNRYKEGNIVDDQILTENKPYYGMDVNLSYHFKYLVPNPGWFDPYAGAGAGYTYANDLGRPTLNTVVGFRTWLSDRIALDLNTMGKWAVFSSASNHFQHGVGVVYQWDIEKELNAAGEEKAALLRSLQAANQRVLDSVAAARDAEAEARRLAELREREQRESEARRKAADEMERKQGLRDELDKIGAIYFAFNSSYLNDESKKTLDQLAALLKANPELTLEIESHTDARGTDKYNQWLSGRRAAKTTEYLQQEHGLDPKRINAQGLGESQLVNNCEDGVRCTEKEHRMNRRSEFRIVEF